MNFGKVEVIDKITAMIYRFVSILVLIPHCMFADVDAETFFLFEDNISEATGFNVAKSHRYGCILLDTNGVMRGVADVTISRMTRTTGKVGIALNSKLDNGSEVKLRGMIDASQIGVVEVATDLLGNVRYQVWSRPVIDDDGNLSIGQYAGFDMTTAEFQAYYGEGVECNLLLTDISALNYNNLLMTVSYKSVIAVDELGNVLYKVFTKPTMDDDGNSCAGLYTGMNLTVAEFVARYGDRSDFLLSCLPAVEIYEMPLLKDDEGHSLFALIGDNRIEGVLGSYRIIGCQISAASAAEAAYVGTYNLKADEGVFTIAVAKKGKVKISGTTAEGKKVSATAQLLVGDSAACVPVVVPKLGLSFVVWFEDGNAKLSVQGMGNATIGQAGTLTSGAAFRLDAEELARVVNDSTYSQYFPAEVAVSQNGNKWIVAPDASGKAAKAGKVVLKNGVVDETKLGTNPSALKLTYTAKTGNFKGSFKVYIAVKGKLKALSATVTGVMINGIGYGTATIKKYGSVEVLVH